MLITPSSRLSWRRGRCLALVVRMPVEMFMSHIRVAECIPESASDSSFLLIWTLGGSSDDSSIWASAIHMGNLASVPSYWLQPGSTLATAAIFPGK